MDEQVAFHSQDTHFIPQKFVSITNGTRQPAAYKLKSCHNNDKRYRADNNYHPTHAHSGNILIDELKPNFTSNSLLLH
jgi:hypothetical protein